MSHLKRLLEALEAARLEAEVDAESAHLSADNALLDYIEAVNGDDEVRRAWNAIQPKWYA